MSRYRDHNIRQIKAALMRVEASQKGTAPSYLNLESDKGKPGPVSPLSTKAYDHIDAVLRSSDNSHVTPDDATNISLSSRKIAYALAHVRRTRFDFYRAILRVENDPGIVRRWQDDKEEDSERWLYSWEKACEEAADFVEGTWPGTRLYVPNRTEEPIDAPKAGSYKRADVLRQKKFDWQDSARAIGRQLEEIMRTEDCNIKAAKGLLQDRRGLGPRQLDRKWDFYRDEKAREDEGVA